MSARINMRVISYCSIPEEITEKEEWLQDYPSNCLVTYSVMFDKDARSELDNWIVENHPDLEKEEFLIEMDY